MLLLLIISINVQIFLHFARYTCANALSNAVEHVRACLQLCCLILRWLPPWYFLQIRVLLGTLYAKVRPTRKNRACSSPVIVVAMREFCFFLLRAQSRIWNFRPDIVALLSVYVVEHRHVDSIRLANPYLRGSMWAKYYPQSFVNMSRDWRLHQKKRTDYSCSNNASPGHHFVRSQFIEFPNPSWIVLCPIPVREWKCEKVIKSEV